MRTQKSFLALYVLFCLIFGFPMLAIGSTMGGPSYYINGNVHSNQDVNLNGITGSYGCSSSDEEYWVNGDVSAVGTVYDTAHVNGTCTSSASAISIPEVDFAAFQAENGEVINAAWGSSEIIYVDGDVEIYNHRDTGNQYGRWRRHGEETWNNISDYQNKTIVATGNITVDLKHESSSSYALLQANLIARGNIDIDVSNAHYGSDSAGVNGLVYAQGGVDVTINGVGKVEKNIKGVVIAKNSSISAKFNGCAWGCANDERGIEYANVITDDILRFFKIITYWREVR